MSPDPGAQPVTQASGRTLNDYLKEYLARPDVVEQMKPWRLLSSTLEGVRRNVFDGVDDLQRAVESPLRLPMSHS